MTDPARLKLISDRLLHDVRAAVTDLRIDEAELHGAAEFFNELGRAGEFADMIDIFFGVTSVVATLGAPGGTTPNLAGPYYKADAPRRHDGRLYEGELSAEETPLTVRGRVLDLASGQPVPGAVLDLWQADGAGVYDETGYHLRGKVTTDEDGQYEYLTVLPEGYQIPAKGPTTTLLDALGQHNWRPAHIHMRIHVGDSTPLQTQFFMGGAKYLDSDPVNAVYNDLVIEHRDNPDAPGRLLDFDVRLHLDEGSSVQRVQDGPKSRAAAL